MPRPRPCSFALANSGEPFDPRGVIDDKPKITPPISY